MRSYILWGIFTWIAQGEGLKIPPVRYCPIQLFQATGISNTGRIYRVYQLVEEESWVSSRLSMVFDSTTFFSRPDPFSFGCTELV